MIGPLRIIPNSRFLKSIDIPGPGLHILTIHVHKVFLNQQELQEVLKFPIEIFWNLEASLKSELLYF